jgi:hypothetical protein
MPRGNGSVLKNGFAATDRLAHDSSKLRANIGTQGIALVKILRAQSRFNR